MPDYQPLARGPYPVGVRTEAWHDAEYGITYPVEIYYPATAEYAGADVDPTQQDSFENQWEPGVILRQAAVRDAQPLTGEFPYVITMHGWSGFRVEFTYLSTHLASHGYLVVSPDIPGSTAGDVAAFFADPAIVGRPEALHGHVTPIRETRYLAVPFLVQTGLDRLPVKDELVGFTGPSFGGWTALIAPRLDPRIKASVPQCPAGGNVYVEGTRQELGAIDHGCPTLMLVGSRDSMLPLFGQFEIYHDLVPGTRRMIMLLGGDHNHFGDDIEAGHEWMIGFLAQIAEVWPTTDWDIVSRLVRPYSELAPAAPTNDLWRMAILGHFDAHLKKDPDAAAFMDDGNFTRVLESKTGLKIVTVDD
jgi:dienelactone hydrolase